MWNQGIRSAWQTNDPAKRHILILLVSGALMIMCYFGTLKWGSGVKANDNIYMIELEGQTVDLETAIRMSQEK